MYERPRPLIRPHLGTQLANLLGEAQRAHARALADLDALAFEHRRGLANLEAKVTELHEVIHDVVGILRRQADVDVATLKRELQTVLLRLSRPVGPLN